MTSPAPRYSARLLSAVLAGALVAAGCERNVPEQSDPNIYSWSGPLAAPGNVQVRSMNGPIIVKPSTDGNVRLEASAKWHRGNPKRDLQFLVATEGSTVRLCVLWNKGKCTATNYTTTPSFLSGIFHTRGTDATVSLTVYVPSLVNVDAQTINGDVDVDATAPVRAQTVNGAVRVATAVGPVVGETVNGSVDIRMTTLGEDGPVKAETVNGSAVAYLPRKLDGTVQVGALNGSVGSDFSLVSSGAAEDKRSLKGAIGAGGRLIKVEAINGSAWLHMLNADGSVAGVAPVKP